MWSIKSYPARRAAFVMVKTGAVFALIGSGACREIEAAREETLAEKWISGSWSGSFESTVAEAGSALRATDVEASFTVDDERSGKFEMSLPRVEASRARGTFTDFANKGLILKLSEESTLAELGAPGVSVSVDYQLEEGALELFNDRVRLRLLRAAPQEAREQEGAPPAHPLLGSWRCDDAKRRTWLVDLKSPESFAIGVRQEGAATLWLHGDVSWQGDARGEAVMVTTSSRSTRYVGTAYRLQFVSEGKALFVRMPSASGASFSNGREEFFCVRP